MLCPQCGKSVELFDGKVKGQHYNTPGGRGGKTVCFEVQRWLCPYCDWDMFFDIKQRQGSMMLESQKIFGATP